MYATNTCLISVAPSVDPTITGYTNGTVLYVTNNQQLTCTQTGGNPPSALTWTCPNIVGDPGTPSGTSQIQVNVDSSLNKQTCTCTAEHPDQTVGYTRTVSVVFTVHCE